ncbi:MAG: hypothetical protein HC794_03675 [Nitrospiraceae bacterium]|nr:hypothetical protein [Nitrospiraceae bacterium]
MYVTHAPDCSQTARLKEIEHHNVRSEAIDRLQELVFFRADGVNGIAGVCQHPAIFKNQRMVSGQQQPSVP